MKIFHVPKNAGGYNLNIATRGRDLAIVNTMVMWDKIPLIADDVVLRADYSVTSVAKLNTHKEVRYE